MSAPASRRSLGDAEKQHGRDHRDHEAEHVELHDVSGAEDVRDDASDDGADEAQSEGGEQAETLPARLDEPRKGADDKSRDDKADHSETAPFTRWPAPAP